MRREAFAVRAEAPVIIFGAGIVGEVLLCACRDTGIVVEAFCDNNANKTSLCGLEVIHVPQLKDQYPDADFIISSADIRDVVKQLEVLGYDTWNTCVSLLKGFDFSAYQFSKPTSFVEYAVNAAILCHESYLSPDKLFLRSVDIIITERCSNKCRDCSNLMQYYQRPKDCNIGELIKSIDAFCGVVDEVNEFRVLGGEPFMNKEAHLVIRRLIDEPKVKKVIIYTNGGFVPKKSQIAAMKSSKLLFIVTDYGPLSKNLNQLIKVLSDNDLSFLVQKAQGWTDCSKLQKHERNSSQQKDIFRKCCSKNTFTISDGKLFRCPFSANASRLKATPDFQADFINFVQESEDLKGKIKAFLLEKEFLETCDYCNGRSFGDPEIPPAIQINKPLEYRKY